MKYPDRAMKYFAEMCADAGVQPDDVPILFLFNADTWALASVVSCGDGVVEVQFAKRLGSIAEATADSYIRDALRRALRRCGL